MKKRKLAFVVIVFIGLWLVLLIYSDVKMRMMKIAEGRPVENADAVYEELGIDISMPEKISGTSAIEYSIIEEKIGQVCFRYIGRKYYLQATKEQLTFEEMGFIVKEDSWTGTTLESEDGEHLTGIEWIGLEDGGSVVFWSWNGIRFFAVSSEEKRESQPVYIIYQIAVDSYYQPTVKQRLTED